MKKKNYTHDLIRCRHCNNSSRLELIDSISDFSEEETDEGIPVPSQGDVYELLSCEYCGNKTIRKYFWTEQWDGEEDRMVDFIYLYPQPPQTKKLLGLPKEIESEYIAAQAVRDINANAYGVLLRRFLEAVCIEQKASGKSLHEQLQDLAKKGVIPDTLAQIAMGLKNMGNIGAHAGIGNLTKDETSLMTTLCEAVIEYVYSAPQLLKLAQERLDKIRNKK